MKKIILAVVILSFLIIAGGLLLIFGYFDSSDQLIGVEMSVPSNIYRGVPFEMVVDISNQSNSILKEADLSLDFSDGLIYLGSIRGSNSRETLGDLGIGSLLKRTYTLLATQDPPAGEASSNYWVDAALSYAVGVGTRFSTSQSKEIVVEKSAIQLEINIPEQILSGSVFIIEVKYKNQSNFDFDELNLEIQYPQNFKFVSSTFPPSSLNNYWSLGKLRSSSEGSFEIKGIIEGQPQASFTFPIMISANFLGESYSVTGQSVDILISPSPVNLSIFINNGIDYTARIGDRLSYFIHYQNNSSAALTDVEIRGRLVGELFDFTTLNTSADFDSVTNTLIWNKNNNALLSFLAPNTSGVASFEIRLLPQFPIKRLNDKNYNLRFEVELKSLPDVSALMNLNTKVSGLITIDTQAYFRDALSNILNTGSIPPQVNRPTQYTVHWIIRNYSTDVSAIEARAFLQAGVIPTGIVKSNIDSVPLYDENTNEMVWNIDNIPATKGVIGNPIEAVFQIQAIPSSAQVDQYQPLLGETRIRAKDEFVDLILENFDTALTTSLPDDVTVGQGGGRVMP